MWDRIDMYWVEVRCGNNKETYCIDPDLSDFGEVCVYAQYGDNTYQVMVETFFKSTPEYKQMCGWVKSLIDAKYPETRRCWVEICPVCSQSFMVLGKHKHRTWMDGKERQIHSYHESDVLCGQQTIYDAGEDIPPE